MINKNKSTLVLLGGTGFIGRAILQYFLDNEWEIWVITRSKDIDEVTKKLSEHEFNVLKYIKNNNLHFIFNIDFLSSLEDQITKDVTEVIPWNRVVTIINAAGETSGSPEIIREVNLRSAFFLKSLASFFKKVNKLGTVCHIGSVVEKTKEIVLSPYDKSKKESWEYLCNSGIVDIHIIPMYVKGLGEIKMTKVANRLSKINMWSARWLGGHNVSVVDVDSLAGMMYFVNSFILKHPEYRLVGTLDVFVTSGELSFSELVSCLVNKGSGVGKVRPILRGSVEYFFLNIFYKLIKTFFYKNQYLMRLAKFSLKSLFPEKNELGNVFPNIKQIESLSKVSNSLLFKNDKYLTVFDYNKKELLIWDKMDIESLKKKISRSIKNKKTTNP